MRLCILHDSNENCAHPSVFFIFFLFFLYQDSGHTLVHYENIPKSVVHYKNNWNVAIMKQVPCVWVCGYDSKCDMGVSLVILL